MPQKFTTLGLLNGFNYPVCVLHDAEFERGKVKLENFTLQEASNIYWNLHDIELSMNLTSTTQHRTNYFTYYGDPYLITHRNLQIANNLTFTESSRVEGINEYYDITLPAKFDDTFSRENPLLANDNMFSLEIDDGRIGQGTFYLHGPFIENFVEYDDTTAFDLNYYFLLEFSLADYFGDIKVATSLEDFTPNCSFRHSTTFLERSVNYFVASGAREEDFSYQIDLNIIEKIWQPNDYRD